MFKMLLIQVNLDSDENKNKVCFGNETMLWKTFDFYGW